MLIFVRNLLQIFICGYYLKATLQSRMFPDRGIVANQLAPQEQFFRLGMSGIERVDILKYAKEKKLGNVMFVEETADHTKNWIKIRMR